MALTKFTTDVANIAALENRPNDTTGQALTPEALKAKFDKGPTDIKTYINDTLTSEVDTLDSANVKLTGNQTVAGIKTFSSSPVVPTPTTDMQAATKKYADDHINNTSNPHSVTATQVGALVSIDGVVNNGGNIDLIGGTGITITPNDTNNTITITATGESLPAAHASTHAAGETDEITPASIGAATESDLSDLAGTGRTTETVKGNADNLATHLADFVSIKEYGAMGDGVTDDRVAIQNALDTLAEGSYLFFPPGTYYISTGLNLTRKINIIGIRGYSILTGDATTLLNVYTPTQILSSNLSGALSGPTETIALLSVANVEAEDLVYILDDSRQWPYDARSNVYYGEINIVKSVNTATNQLTLFIQTATNYPDNAKVYIYRPISDFEITGITFKRKTISSNSDVGLSLLNTRNVRVKDVTVSGFGGAGILDYRSIGNTFNNIHCKNLFYAGIGMGYGIQVGGSIETQISDSTFHYCKRGVDLSGGVPSRYCCVSNSEALVSTVSADDASGFGTHGSAQYCKFMNCRVHGSKNAFILRGLDLILESCESYGAANYFASCSAGYGHTIQNCQNDKYVVGDYHTSGFVYVNSPDYVKGLKSLIIKNCIARISDQFLMLDVSCPSSDIYIENTKVFLRLVTKSFIYTADMSTAKVFNIHSSDTRMMLNDGTIYTYTKRVGTNVSLNIYDIKSLSDMVRKESSGNASPTSGTWVKGDIVWNNNPTAGSYLGWICITNGTPGTWKGFGVIEA